MKVTSKSFSDGATIPGEFAFAVPDSENHVKLSANRNPHLEWSEVPDGTRSFAIVCHDPDVPSRPDDVNREGRTVPADLPRVDFFHWILVDVPAARTSVAAGEFSEGVTAGGKDGPDLAQGMRHGRNNYTQWFEGDENMGGDYFGYDGPCPPWNDSIVHHYHFTVYALDVERLAVEGAFDGAAARAAMEGHVLAEARVTGLYSLNPDVEPI